MIVLSLFDGISCGQVALERSGIKVEKYFASEIDKYAIKVTQANYPNTIQLGDIRNIKGKDLPQIDLLIGGSPCFAAETKILTEFGYKNIEDIKIGDMVLTHNNRYQKVINIGSDYKELYKLKCQGMCDTYTTENHPYYIRSMSRVWNNLERKYIRSFSELKWKNVRELEKNIDFLTLPIIKKEENPLNLDEEFCWLLGRYAADGHYRKDKRKNRKNSYQYQVIYSIGDKKLEYFKSKVKTKHFTFFKHSDSTYRCVFSSMEFVNFIIEHKFGKGAINKRIPSIILNLPIELIKIFLDGYLSGDGCKEKTIIKANSVSKELIMGLNLLIAKAYKVNSSFTMVEKQKTTTIEGRTVNQKDYYETEFRLEIKKQSHAKVIDNYISLPIRHVKPIGILAKVYNLEVEIDNSYTANNMIVHNCQGFSFAGKRLNFDDPRSKLFFEYTRLLGECKPTYFLLENVKMKKECQDIISGYLGVQPIRINSNLVSAQNRDRLYWTNIPDITQPTNKNILLSSIIDRSIIGDELWYNKRIHLNRRNIIQSVNDDKSYCIQTQFVFNPILKELFRYLTIEESEILQTLPINYTKNICKTQRIKAVGNCWTVDVVKHIFDSIPKTA